MKKFTLIELLMVILIIGILTTIVMALGPRINRSAQNRSCTNNLRQLANCATIYSNQDSAARIPGPQPRGQDNESSWDKSLSNIIGLEHRPTGFYKDNIAVSTFASGSQYYTKVLNVFTCPADPEYLLKQNSEGVTRSYLLNLGNDEVDDEDDAIYAGRLEEPSETVLFIENHSRKKYFADRNKKSITTFDVASTKSLFGNITEDAQAIHGDKGNVIFNVGMFDGSCRNILVEEDLLSSEKKANIKNSIFFYRNKFIPKD